MPAQRHRSGHIFQDRRSDGLIVESNDLFEVRKVELPPRLAVPWNPVRNGSALIALSGKVVVDGQRCAPWKPMPLTPSTGYIWNYSNEPSEILTLSVNPDSAIGAYGSRMHGTANENSDLDMHITTTGKATRAFFFGKLTLYSENIDQTLDKASKGDLFIKQWCNSMVPIFDKQNMFQKIKAAFVPRPSYPITIRTAADTAFMMMRKNIRAINPAFADGKVLWGIRTTLVAEDLDPFLDPHSMTKEDQIVLELSKAAKHDGSMPTAHPAIRDFFDRRGLHDRFPEKTDLNTFAWDFKNAGNHVGLNLCRSLHNKSLRAKAKA